MATKKTTTNKETTTKKTASVKKTEDTPKKASAKKTAEDTVKKTASKKKEDTAAKKDTVKKETAVKKTASKKAEDTPKKTSVKKASEDTSKKEEAVKKTAVKKTSSVVKKEDEVKAIEKADKTEKAKTLDSIIKKEDEKKEEKKDLKELLKSSQDRKISLKTSTPVRKIDSIKTENSDSKPERESITLLKEAIKAKSKNVSRPVSVKKRILIDDNDDNIANDNVPLNISKPVSSSLFDTNEKEKDEKIFSFNKFDLDKKEDTENKYDTYSKISSSDSVTDTYHFEKLDENNNEEKDTEEQTADNTYSSAIEEEKDEIVEQMDNIDEPEEAEEIKDNAENNSYEDDIEENDIKEEASEEEEIKEIAEVAEIEEIKEDEKDNKDSIEEKVTYSKSDIFKRVVIPNLNDNEEIQKSKFNNQEEMDKAVENAPIIHEDEKVENYKNYTVDKTIEDEKSEDNEKLQELREKDIKIIETEDELKTSSLPEIERKPVEPYVAPAHSMENNKKQNKLVPIIGIIIIILGLSFLGIQFFTGKNNNTDDGFYDIVTNETINNNADTNNNNAALIQTNTVKENTNAVIQQTNTARPQTNNVRPQTNTVRQQTNTTRPQTNNVRPQTNNAVNTQTNTRVQTNTPPTPPKEPEITPPTPPTPPPNPPAANNTNASISGLNQNNDTSGLSTYKTQWNDTLSSIATKELGDGRRWPSIFVLNQNLMKSPDDIVFNIYIKIPKGGKKKVADMTDNEKRSLYNDYLKVAEIYSKIGKQNQANTIKSQANSILK